MKKNQNPKSNKKSNKNQNTKLKINKHPANPRIFSAGKNLITPDLSPEYSVYQEEKITVNSHTYRVWDPYRSKLAAAILKGLTTVPLHKGDTVLYLGAATGTTASHISDIVGESGVVYCVEFSPTPCADLIELAHNRKNIFPVLADAHTPVEYTFMVGGIDMIYCDVAQPDQADIITKNASLFLRSNGHLLHAVKASSIDAGASPATVYQSIVSDLSHTFSILTTIPLDPYQKKHAMVWGRYTQ
ncbi:MAG: fibrillarin-like rRNA/tRNA 2'-O-methyltransferase [Candidatus Methanofastidiosia archaeon]|jgi:fibrillarin-like pre-rRNA processing protein